MIRLVVFFNVKNKIYKCIHDFLLFFNEVLLLESLDELMT